jgi:hypothetical protein
MHLPWYLLLNSAACEAALLLMFSRTQWRSLFASVAATGRLHTRETYHG